MPMTVQRVEAAAYAGIFDRPVPHIYNSVRFAQLNAHKCDEVYYLLLRDSKIRFGIIMGRRGDCLCSPFSAPFGGFSYNSVQSVESVDAAVSALAAYLRAQGLAGSITLPPEFYDPAMQPKFASALMRNGRLEYCDIDHYADITPYAGDDWLHVAETRFSAKARPRLRHSLGLPIQVEHFGSRDTAGIRRAYAVIAANRAHKGYPLRMSLDDILATAPVTDARFTVMTHDGTDIAAAMLYPAAESIMQVIYWGDTPGHDEQHPMHRLAAEVMHRCAADGYRILDIGPSSESGHPSHGLCTFKESVSALPTLKPRFIL